MFNTSKTPDRVPHVKLNNGCLADNFPHKYPCHCSDCDAIWENLRAEELVKKLEGNRD
jgi:hypothetical protein